MLSRGQIDPEYSMRIQSMCIGACTVSINGTQMVWGGGSDCDRNGYNMQN